MKLGFFCVSMFLGIMIGLVNGCAGVRRARAHEAAAVTALAGDLDAYKAGSRSSRLELASLKAAMPPEIERAAVKAYAQGVRDGAAGARCVLAFPEHWAVPARGLTADKALSK